MKISVIIPAFNAVRYLASAVESLVATGYSELEIMVVDDGSSDGTLAVAEDLAARYPEKVFVLNHPGHANRGVSASRNLGINSSSGELICFLDADDYVFPHRFDVCVPVLEHDIRVDGVYEWATIVFESATERDRWPAQCCIFGPAQSVEGDNLLQVMLRGATWHTNCIIFRRSLLSRTGLFRKRLRIAEDCNLWFRMAAIGHIVPGNSNRPVAAYRRHGTNTYQYDLERKVDILRAMADFARWARQRKIRREMQAVIAEESAPYAVRALISAREAARRLLAWRIAFLSISGLPFLWKNTSFLRQVAAMLRGK